MRYTVTFTDCNADVRRYNRPISKSRLPGVIKDLTRKAPTKGFPATLITIVAAAK